ncbi:hypothetical protein E4T56_gene10719 [Termitomyces sp. T112]|nr:hypothetical protein E4T56_gene10719 [Termitomyces sp. T112]
MPRISRALARLLTVPPRLQPISSVKRPSLSLASLRVPKPLLLSRPSYLPLSTPAAWSSSPILAAILQLQKEKTRLSRAEKNLRRTQNSCSPSLQGQEVSDTLIFIRT